MGLREGEGLASQDNECKASNGLHPGSEVVIFVYGLLGTGFVDQILHDFIVCTLFLNMSVLGRIPAPRGYVP